MLEFTTIADHANLSVDVTQPRQTPPPAERRFAAALADGIGAVVGGAGELAAAALPGGAILAAATRELTSQTQVAVDAAAGDPGTGQSPEGPGSSGSVGTSAGGSTVDEYWRLQQQSQDFNLQFLQLQEGLSHENRRFSTLSNVLKARHDTSKAVIQNIR
ncbi:MAG: hypothetical protein JXB32_19555 [Deltaproteobacteria bacterium]|nr:hypothetical protein [Deltaproteobacteria bacterium]